VYNLHFKTNDVEFNQHTIDGDKSTQDGITVYNFERSETEKKDVVDLFVRSDTKDLDNVLVAVNELGEAYDFEVGNSGFYKNGDFVTGSGYDAGDELGQVVDQSQYQKKNLTSISERQGEFFKKMEEINAIKDPVERVKKAAQLLNDEKGYRFATDGKRVSPASEIKKYKNDPDVKGSNIPYVYRVWNQKTQAYRTVKGKFE
jgi:hypothetical protein